MTTTTNKSILLPPSHFTSNRLLPPSTSTNRVLPPSTSTRRQITVRKQPTPIHLLPPSHFSKTTISQDNKKSTVQFPPIPNNSCNSCKNTFSTSTIDLRSKCICDEELEVDLSNFPPMNHFETFDIYLCREDDMERPDGVVFFNDDSY